MKRLLTTVLSLFLLGMGSLYAQNTLRGVVKDSDTDTPVQDVRVRLLGTTFETLSNAGGVFTLVGVPDGKFTFEVSIVGYPTIT